MKAQQDNPYQEQLIINDNKPYLTYVTIALNVVIWIAMSLIGMLKGWNVNEQLLYFGSKVNNLVAGGQYWRLLTAMFLHVNMMHLGFNCYALWIYGRIVEQIYGTQKSIIIYLISGLLGCIFSYVFSSNAAAGASGAIFGLVGSLLYFREKRTEIFKRTFGLSLFLVIGINLVYGFTQSGIDNWGHIGGLIGGFVVSHAIGLYRDRRIDTIKIISLIITIILIVGGVFWGNAKYQGEVYAEKASEYVAEGDLDRALELVQKAHENSPNSQYVQYVVEDIYLQKINQALGEGDFKQAFECIEDLKVKYPDNVDVLYYEAQLYYFTGKSDAALKRYNDIVEAYPKSSVVWLSKGKLEIELKKWDEAEESLNQAKGLDESLKEECNQLLDQIP